MFRVNIPIQYPAFMGWVYLYIILYMLQDVGVFDVINMQEVVRLPKDVGSRIRL